MKKVYVKVALVGAMMASVMVTSCGSSKQVAQTPQTAYQTPQPTSLPQPKADEVMDVPCWLADDDVVFAGTGQASGPKLQFATVQRSALTNAQNIVRQKVKNAYQGMASDYQNLIGDGNAVNAVSNFEAAGDQIIDVTINNTREKCLKQSGVDAKGYITVYVGIVVNKKETADKIADQTVKELSDDKELAIRFKESNYREKMEQKFKEYKDNQKPR
jgi:hypothetical protein